MPSSPRLSWIALLAIVISVPVACATAIGVALTSAADIRSSPEAAPGPDAAQAAAQADPAYVLGYTMNRIDGTEEKLSTYEGKVVLIVNTASRCGLTPQYKALESLYRAKKDAGLVVLGFPANNFAGQEPGSNTEIAQFCTERFDVTFPMFEKIDVIGDKRHPLYARLAERTKDQGGEPDWNFTKYLVDRRGHVVARFEPRTRPDDPKLLERIDALLQQPEDG